MELRYVPMAFVMLVAATQATAKGPRPLDKTAAVHSMNFTVETVDPETREVMLVDSEGWIRSFHPWPRVNNLLQVRKGDIVTVSYVQSVAVELRKTAGGGRAAAVEQARATAPRAKAGNVVSREISLLGTVVDVDRPAGMVAIKGQDGKIVDMAVRKRARLRTVRAGDEVEVLFTETIAVAVTAPRK
jgi:translation initiation factor IF-1